jgi:PAS domain-containing protein
MTDENDERKDSADRSMDSTPSTGPGQDPSIDSGQFLRKLAEERTGAIEDKDTEVILPGEARRLLHELRMHQIELEMQNEELRRTQEALEASRARYFDLYDMAPVGYFTLSEQGLILEANLTAATLLGVPRGALVKQPLTRSIVSEDQDIYYLHRKNSLRQASGR